jgi:(2Fe-2S) ferredoxin
MEPYRLHVFFCRQQKPGGLTCCGAREAAGALAALQAAIAAEGLGEEVMVTTCDSLGLCGRGPNMIVYPEGLWYHGVTAETAPEIVREHFRLGRPVERLLERDMAVVRAEFQAHRARLQAWLAGPQQQPQPQEQGQQQEQQQQ